MQNMSSSVGGDNMSNLQAVMEALKPVFETLVDHNPGKKNKMR